MKDYHRRKNCRLCGSTSLELVLSLRPTPPANELRSASETGKEQEKFPLDIFFCNDCHHCQLLDVVSPERLFQNYVYVSGTSPVFVKHFQNYASDVLKKYNLSPGGFVVDVGSNDGTLLQFFKQAGYRVLGIDPAVDISETANENGIPTLTDFFSPALAERIVKDHGSANVIVANNVFAHIDDLKSIVDGIKILLDPEGIFVFEVSYLLDVVEKTLFDTIYHEHLCYHSVGPLKRFFEKNGMELIDTMRVSSHGGSLRAVAKLQNSSRIAAPSVEQLINLEKKLGLDKASTFKKFGDDIQKVGHELKSILASLKNEGKKVAGYGFPAKATTLMHHFEIGPELIDFVIDDNPLKQGLYTPGLNIPVVSSAVLKEQKVDYLLILAWNFAQPIMEKLKDFKQDGGHFIVPLPKVEVI